MDGTLLQGRSIFVFAEKLGFSTLLSQVMNQQRQPYEKSIEIAKLLQGTDTKKLLTIFQEIPLQPYVQQIIERLKEKQITTAIATDSYQFLADDLKNRLDFDYAFANKLITKQYIATGEIHLHNHLLQPCSDGRVYSICKERIIDHLCKRLQISTEQVIAIGDGIVDIGMIRKAGVGIAFNAKENVQNHADVVTSDLRVILEYI